MSRDSGHRMENAGAGQCSGSVDPDAKSQSILVHPHTFPKTLVSEADFEEKVGVG